ncbi:MAG: hypothetical protein WCE87_09180 [Candidatus Udaeobacter sp.]
MTSRVRCSCGRVYDPAKHTTCPECGAESAVESVVVAEKVKSPVPPELDRESTQSGVAGATGTTGGREGQAQRAGFLKDRPWPIYAGAGAFVLVILFFLLRSQHGEQLVKKGGERSPPVPQEASPTPAISISPSAVPTTPTVTPESPTPASSAAPSFAPDGFQLDPRLIGSWETKGPWPPNSDRVQTVHWTIETDGHFTFSGPWSDAGAITASSGKMKWFSNNGSQPADLTYEFNGDSLVTHGPLGDALWWRAKRSSQQSRRSTRDKPRRNTAPDDAVRREILRRMFNHFPR